MLEGAPLSSQPNPPPHPLDPLPEPTPINEITMPTTNPLLLQQPTIPFERIRPEHIAPAVDARLTAAQERVEAIINVTGPRTFENTMLAFDRINADLNRTWAVLSHIDSVLTEKEFQAAYSAQEGRVTAHYAGIWLSAELWQAVSSYAASDEARQLTGPRKRFLEKTVRDFKLAGAELEAPQRERLGQIEVELSTLGTKFQRNLTEATKAFELVVSDPARLQGMPDHVLSAARASAEKKGLAGWRFTLDAPSYLPFLTYCPDRELREQIFCAHAARSNGGEFDNLGIAAETIRLRREKTALLGFDTFADLVTVNRMAKGEAGVRAFLTDLESRLRPHAAKEHEALCAYRQRLEGAQSATIEPWDVEYYATKLQSEQLDFDPDSLRPYFPMETALQGAFEIAHRLYGVTVRPLDLPKWHESVSSYELLDQDGKRLGAFYIDFYARESKRGGAWMNELEIAVDGEPHQGLMCGNFTPPQGDRPAQLSHDEVITLLHEFGHLLNSFFWQGELRGLSAFYSPWDMIELPSQILENWAWERESLDLLARHVDDGSKVPEESFQKLLASQHFRSASFLMGLAALAWTDLEVHTSYDPATHGDISAFGQSVFKQHFAGVSRENRAVLSSFQHLFAGSAYAIGYYCYSFAAALDADGYTRFKQAGIFDRQVAAEFRRDVLAIGDSEDPPAAFRRFLGRESNLDALMARAGLSSTP